MKRQLIGICMLPLWLLLLSLPVSLHPQSIRKSAGITGRNADNTVTRNDVAAERTGTGIRGQVQAYGLYGNDTVYSTQIRKQHGWLMPQDTIGRDDVLHRNASYRFTRRYPSGHWGKMEIVDSYGNLSSGYLSTYLLEDNQSGAGANARWIEKLNTGCVHEFIADPSGKNVIQERVYDKDGNMIYTYSRVPIGDRQYIGSYKDSYGLPAEMRKDSLFTYGTLVRLTEDRWGNDSIVEYIDAKGRRKPNSDGVAMEAFIYDRYGHVLKQQSRDGRGNLVTGKWGNCGTEYEWDRKHQVVSMTYMDERWQPMRMRNTGKEGEGNGIMKVVYSYDRYGRQTEEAYYTADNVPDSDVYGVHRTVYSYDVRGNLTRAVNYDRDGAPAGNNIGIAYMIYEYDNAGRCVRRACLDKDGRPHSEGNYLSGVVYGYDDEGRQILYEEYSVADGKEIMSYREESGKDHTYYRWSDGSVRIDSLDARGRLTSSFCYDKDGNLSRTTDYAVNRVEYIESPRRLIMEDSYYDADGNLCNQPGNYAVQKLVSDTLDRYTRNFIRMYDAQGNLFSTSVQTYDKKGNLISENDANAFGVICRSGGNSMTRYYRGDVMYSTSGEQMSSFISRDEFGEPDYAYYKDGIYYYAKITHDGYARHYDEHNRPITDQRQFKDACPKLMTVEVTDPAAYRRGLRDNDVILIDGGYAADILTLDSIPVPDDNLIRDWALHSVLDAGRSRSMVVFRVDPETLEYGLVKIDSLEGSPSDIGYLAHIRYLTRKQVERIQACVAEDMASDTPLARWSGPEPEEDDYEDFNRIVIAYTDMNRDERLLPYGRLVTDPAVLVASCMKEGGMVWRMGDSYDVFKKIYSVHRSKMTDYPHQHFYLTKNGKDVTDWDCGGNSENTRWLKVSVPDKIYRRLLPLLERTEPAIAGEMAGIPRLEKKRLWGDWSYHTRTDSDSVAVCLSLLKDGTMRGYMEKYAPIRQNDVSVTVRYRRSLEGKWHVSGRLLEWTLPEGNTPELECIGLSGGDTGARAEAWSVVEYFISNEPWLVVGDMHVVEPGNLFRVFSLSADSLLIESPTVRYPLSRELRKGRKKAVATREALPVGGPESWAGDADARRLAGDWWTSVPELSSSSCVLSLKDDGKVKLSVEGDLTWNDEDSITVCIHLDCRMEGRWEFYGGYLNVILDYTTLESDTGIGLDGFEDPLEAEQYRNTLSEEIGAYGLARIIIDGISGFGVKKVEDVTEEGFTFDGVRFGKGTSLSGR